MDVTSGKQAREGALVGAGRGLLAKGDHNASILPKPPLVRGSPGSARASASELLVPTESVS